MEAAKVETREPNTKSAENARFHRWQVICGMLVYRGPAHPTPTYRPAATDFMVEERESPFAVCVRISGRTEKVPVFHPISERHAAQLKKDHTLQPNHFYC